MLLETPWPGVDELDELNPDRELAITIGASPTGFEKITTREDLGPTLTQEESNDDDECTLDRDHSRFELHQRLGLLQMCQAWSVEAYHVDLVHDSLECRKTSSQEDTAEGQSRVEVITHWQEMRSCILCRPDDDLAILLLLQVDTARLGFKNSRVLKIVAHFEWAGRNHSGPNLGAFFGVHDHHEGRTA